jgi:signal transduction histidine kinase
VDREQIRCVLDEVVKNAVDATGENDGIVTIRWRADLADTLGTGYLAALGELPAGAAANRWVEIEIQDTGCGMSEAVAQRVFDPFFSHRAAGRGRGLGLARAHRTVEAHGGRIWVVSAPGLGSTFHIRLPQVVRE